MKLKNFHKVINETPEYVKHDIKLSLDIMERIHELLELKFEGKQNLLAKRLGKTEAEVSKWFNGYQNFTTKTISKLQEAFEESIIVVCTSKDEGIFELVKTPYGCPSISMEIGAVGLQEVEAESEYDSINQQLFVTKNKIEQFA